MTGLADYLALHAGLQPDQLAVADLASGRRWSYAALDRSVGACARLLIQDYALTSGDRVACLGKNRAEILILHLACARTGLVFVPINWRLSPSEIGQLLEDAEPGLVFGDGEMASAGVDGVPLSVLAEKIDAADPLASAEPDPDRPSLILYTSGTSGRPKGALLSERNLAQTAVNFGVLGRVSARSVFLIDSPMFHIIGLVTSMRPALMFGGAMLISDGFQPSRTLERLADPALGVTHYFCVPQMAASLRAQPGFDPARLRGLTAVFTGGAPHPAEDILAWVDQGVPIVDGFGMSEAGTVFGMPVDLDQIRAKAGCVGLPTPLVRARIVDGAEADCPAGAAGELLLRGDNIFRGYWRRPDETAASFTEDGWFRTGDIAVRDGDGFYRLVDRKKDMFISGGENVYPAEIEAALAGLPGLVECAVVGVADPRWGEVGVCVYVPASGGVGDRHLLDHLSPRLARYKLPRRFVPIDRLPRTGSGKILKTELRAWLRDRLEQ
jgi:fatty-acyl-CoA synthase